jgi:hypothetical protein
MRKLILLTLLIFNIFEFQYSCLAITGSRVEKSVNKRDTILNIGSQRELFVDDHLISRMNNLEFRMHSPVSRETVMLYDQPWEGSGSDFQTVFKDGDIFRMYYMAAQLTYAGGAKFGGHAVFACYAESMDGIHWKKPDLGLFEFNGSKKNNIVWATPDLDNFTPFIDSNIQFVLMDLYLYMQEKIKEIFLPGL